MASLSGLNFNQDIILTVYLWGTVLVFWQTEIDERREERIRKTA